MRVYEVRLEKVGLRGLEVENRWLSRKAVARVLQSVPGCRITRGPRSWQVWADETFCEFEINGVAFHAFEPFGDNPRYWIGPNEPGHSTELLLVRDAFLRLWRPEWISTPLLAGLALLWLAVRGAQWQSFGSWTVASPARAVGGAAGLGLLAWWAREAIRGRYRSRVVADA